VKNIRVFSKDTGIFTREHSPLLYLEIALEWGAFLSMTYNGDYRVKLNFSNLN